MVNNAQSIKVRQVTNVHTNWSEQGGGEPGKFSFQLILDDGAEEYVIRPAAQDAKVLLKLVKESDNLFFDTDRKVLVSSSVK